MFSTYTPLEEKSERMKKMKRKKMNESKHSASEK